MDEMFKLYFTKASMMGLSNQAQVEFVFSQVSDEFLHWDVNSIKPYSDEFGDLIICLNLSFFPDFGYPVIKFRLQNPRGETGFDLIKTPTQIYDFFLGNSYLLTDRTEPLLSFSEFMASRTDPTGFFSQKGKIPLIITYHRPNVDLGLFLKEHIFSITDAAMNLNILIESAHLCEAVIVWSLAYGTNPLVISTQSKNFIARMKQELSSVVYLKEVSSEKKLPEW